MTESAFNKFFWGFILIMLGFRIQGFDILPDIVGYLLFASAFRDLASSSDFFSIAAKYNIAMIVLSIFSIYQKPVQGGGVNFGALGILGIPIAIAAFVLSLLVVYNLFMGIKDMAEKQGQLELAKESEERWDKYKILQIAIICSFLIIFIPGLGIVYLVVIFIAAIIVTIGIVGFIKRCGESLRTL
jgi:hypothetical protein